MTKLNALWMAMLSLLPGCGHRIGEHKTSDGMVIVGSVAEQPEYAKAMFDENFSAAEAIASKLVDANPNDAACLIALAHPQMLLGKTESAIKNYEKAIELEPKNTIALYSRGLVAQELGDFDTAKDFYERTLKVDPKSPDGHYGMAAACEGLGLHARVIEHASAFLKISPNSKMKTEAQDMIDVATRELDVER